MCFPVTVVANVRPLWWASSRSAVVPEALPSVASVGVVSGRWVVVPVGAMTWATVGVVGAISIAACEVGVPMAMAVAVSVPVAVAVAVADVFAAGGASRSSQS